MGYPVNPELTRRIVNDAFYAEIEAAAQERLYPLIAEEIQQDVVTVIRPSMGAVPKPTQLSGTASGGNGARSKEMKDYKYTTTVHEWDLTVDKPRSVAEDLPEEMARISRNLGASATVFFDERAVQQLDSTADTGYDGVSLFNTAHPEAAGIESGAFASQDNAKTAATDPTAPADIETSLEVSLKALRNFRDDQARPVNEGVTRFTILISPLEEWAYQGILNPTRSLQAIDKSGGTGKFRGMFDVKVSAYVPSKTHYIFAQGRTKRALGFYMRTPWTFNSNIGTDADSWQLQRRAVLVGYGRFEMLPLDWKTAIRYVHTGGA
jgi:hypothetical protein